MIKPNQDRSYFEKLIEDNPSIAETLRVRMTTYIPHYPTPKQRLALLLPHREVCYGGAAGGGKSDYLLMAALQYVDIPKYSAIIFRKTITDLTLPGALLDRAREWLTDTDARFKDNCWWFPSGARLQFAYLSSELDKHRYQGAEFQFIGFDEVTQFYEDDYAYLRSRLRKTQCPIHAGNVVDGVSLPLPHSPDCPTCHEYASLSGVPLRFRCATNPGGMGHLWVKKRFDIGPIVESVRNGKPIHRLGDNGKPVYIGRNPKRPFVPALVQDNPYLNQAEYIESLKELDPVTREQLLNGDWSISSDGRFRKSWIRYYSQRGPYIILGADRDGETIHRNKCHIFTICDTASSSREGPGDHQVYRGAPSWTVITTWALTPNNHLVLLDVRRFRDEIPEIYKAIKRNLKEWSPDFIGLEYTSQSIHLYQMLSNAGLPMKPFSPRSQDKLTRAVPATNRMEQGRIWFPQHAPWLEDWESEIFTWTAHPQEQDDQVDCLAYAAIYVTEFVAGAYGEDSVINDMERSIDMTPDSV
jgi:predicted phage terminase large subunit-like protein